MTTSFRPPRAQTSSASLKAPVYHAHALCIARKTWKIPFLFWLPRRTHQPHLALSLGSARQRRKAHGLNLSLSALALRRRADYNFQTLHSISSTIQCGAGNVLSPNTAIILLHQQNLRVAVCSSYALSVSCVRRGILCLHAGSGLTSVEDTHEILEKLAGGST